MEIIQGRNWEKGREKWRESGLIQPIFIHIFRLKSLFKGFTCSTWPAPTFQQCFSSLSSCSLSSLTSQILTPMSWQSYDILLSFMVHINLVSQGLVALSYINLSLWWQNQAGLFCVWSGQDRLSLMSYRGCSCQTFPAKVNVLGPGFFSNIRILCKVSAKSKHFSLF